MCKSICTFYDFFYDTFIAWYFCYVNCSDTPFIIHMFVVLQFVCAMIYNLGVILLVDVIGLRFLGLLRLAQPSREGARS